MIRSIVFPTNSSCWILAAAVLGFGCLHSGSLTAPARAAEEDHGHDGHGLGPHGGALADWGGGKYHVEFTVDHEKKQTIIYVLASDEKTAVPIKTADGKLLLTMKDPVFQVKLTASPLEGEKDGLSSRFKGTHDKLGIVREFSGAISAEVDGTPYVGEFAELPHDDHDEK